MWYDDRLCEKKYDRERNLLDLSYYQRVAESRWQAEQCRLEHQPDKWTFNNPRHCTLSTIHYLATHYLATHYIATQYLATQYLATHDLGTQYLATQYLAAQ